MWKWPSFKWKIGVRYRDGKLLIYRGTDNPENTLNDKPSWAVDIREVLAMVFVGSGALILILKDQYDLAMYLLVALFSYATGRTVPGGK